MYGRQYSRQGGTNRPRIQSQQDRNGAEDPSISISQRQNTYEMITPYYHPTEDVSYQYYNTNNSYVNDNMVSIIPTQAYQHESNQYSIQNEYDEHDVNTTCVHFNTGTNTIVNTTSNDEYHHVDNDDDEQEITTSEVVIRIESMIVSIIQALDDMILPEMVQYNDNSSNSLEDPSTNQPNNDTTCNDDDNENDDGGISGNSIMKKRFTMQQCRSFTSMLLVLAYCHTLLQSDDDDNNQNNDTLRRTTTTTREVYYYYVTHFRSQRECDMTIWDVCTLLQVPRHSLGLQASSKGWFCGNVQLIDAMNHTIQWNGYTYRGEQGCPISSEWLLPKNKRRIRLHSTNHNNNNSNHSHESNMTMDNDISCILIIEKEGIYQRLVQDGFWYKHNCILVTGKGFPDIATRAFVYNAFHQYNHIPVYGLADCDPFGIAILHCYSNNNSNISGGIGTATTTATAAGGRGDRYSVPLYWLGLRPSQVQYLSKPTTFYNITYPALPLAVYQELTDIDRKRLINHFWNNELHSFVLNQHPGRKVEIQNMISMKVELEALYWLGMDFCSMFVGLLLDHAKQQLTIGGSVSTLTRDRPLNYQNDNAHSEYSGLSWMDII